MMKPSLFAIFGDPVHHSLSPLMHNLAFKALGFNGCYTRWRIEDGDTLRHTFFDLHLTGVNITVPHKEAAFEAADWVEEFAAKVRAVNTLVRKDEKLYGYNTDAPGFYRALQALGRVSSALIIGAGGTARALALYLRNQGITIDILNRSAPRLAWFEKERFDCHTWEGFAPKAYDAVINTTSAGLTDNTLPAPESLLDPLLTQTHFAVDVIYGKETPFLKKAKSYKLPILDGSEMLLQQGILAFDHFTDHRYDLKTIEQAMRPVFRLL